MPRSRTISAHDITLTDTGQGWTVEQDRRVLIDRLDEDEAISYCERLRKPDEQVIQISRDGYETDLTKQLRTNRRSRV